MGRPRGERNGETAKRVEALAKAGYHAAAIARALKISRQAVSRIAAHHGIGIGYWADLADSKRRAEAGNRTQWRRA